MELVKFKGHNRVFAEHQPQYIPLPCHVDPKDTHGRLTCCWRLSWKERFKLLFSGMIWHQVLTFHEPLQPQLLLLDKPVMRAEP